MAKTATKVAAPAPKKPDPKPSASKATTAPRASVPATVKPRNEVADPSLANVPAFMQQDVGMGLDKIGNEDLDVPRLKLIQGISPELQEFNDLRAGHFFHTSAEMIFDEPFRVVPIYVQKEYILWNPLDSGGGILARAADAIHWSPSTGEFDVKLDKSQGGAKVKWTLKPTVAQSGLANWGTQNPGDKDSPPAATLMYNFLFGFPDHPELMPAVYSFQRSTIKIGRKFLTKLKTVRTPIFGTVYSMTSTDMGPDSKTYKVPVITGVGLVDSEAMYNDFKAMHESFSVKGLNIKDIDSLADEDGKNDTDEGDDGKPKY